MRRLFLLLFILAFAVHPLSAGEKEDLLWRGARNGDVAAVKAALAAGADVNAKFRYGATALSYACDRDNVEVVKLLLNAGADPNVKDTFYNATPLSWASQKGNAEIIGPLLEKGATGADNVLIGAAQLGQLTVVKVIVEKGKPSPKSLTQALDISLASTPNAETARNRAEVAQFLRAAGVQPTPKSTVQIDAATLQKYAGAYRNESGIEFTFTFKDGKLSGGPTGQNPLNLEPVDNVTFNVSGAPGVVLKFNLEADKVVSISIKVGENTTVYKRVEK